MARLVIRSAGIGLVVLAIAGASWVSATPPAPPAASTPTTSDTPVQPGVGSAATAGRKSAAKPVAKRAWNQLTAAQQAALQPLAPEWNQLEDLRKQKWLDIADRYAGMKPDEQKRVQERMMEWVKLTPEQRRIARENYARSSKIDPSKKSAQWEEYQQLPDDQKRLLSEAAARKKQLANLPSSAQSKAKSIPPIKSGLNALPAASASAAAPPVPPTPPTPPASTPDASSLTPSYAK